MSDATSGTLTQRLDRLEREARTWKRCAAGVVVVVAGLTLMGQGRTPRALDAEQFLLRGPNGKARAALQTAPDGTPLLALFDDNGTTRLGLGFVAGSPNLTFADADGRSRIVLGSAEDGTLTFGFRGRGERLLRAVLGVQPDGSAALALHDKDGKPRVGFEVEADGTSDIVVMNRAGKVIWKAP